MFIIAGLGNPGARYQGTRHNAGFSVIDALADKYNISVDGKKARAYVGKGIIAGQKVILAKPQTYMNLSGESIRGLTDYYKIDVEQELLVIYDDISLAPGQIRIRKKGSAGGHNGMKNIIGHLGGQAADQGGRGGKAQKFRPGGLCAQPFLPPGSGGHGRRIRESSPGGGDDPGRRSRRGDE